MGQLDDSPVISVPSRLNYFPPISCPATMFHRRKKKSARELYHLSPQNHDLVLNNPPVTPWDDPPEFFRNFIGTPDDIKHGDLKTTWPFLRQIGPKCVFKGMPKKARNDFEDVYDIYRVPNTKKRVGSGFNERFLEPECIGISRDFSSPRLQFISPRYHELPSASVERHVTSAPFKDDVDVGSVRQASSIRKVKAPPPSEARSTKSDDSLGDSGIGQYHLSPPFEGLKNYPQQRPTRTLKAKASFEAFRKKHKGPPSGERVVRFEESPLPEKLQHYISGNPESLENSEVFKLTWQDIVQAPVMGTLITVPDETRMSSIHVKRVEPPKKDAVRVSFRLPKTNRRQILSSDKTEREKRVGVKVTDRDIANWIDDVRNAQPYGR